MIHNGLRWARLCLVWMITAQLMLSFHFDAEASRRKSSSRSKRTSHSSRTSAKRKTPKLKGDNVSLRSGPGEKSRRLTLTDIGTRVRILDRRKGWLQVRLPSGKEGWLRGDFVANADSGTRSSSRSASRRRASSATKQTASRRSTSKKTMATSKKTASKKVASAKKTATKTVKPTPPKAVAAVPDRRGTRMLRAEPAEPFETAEKPEVSPEQPAETAEKPLTDNSPEIAENATEATETSADATEKSTGEAERASNRKLPSPPKDIVRTAYAYRGTPYRFGGMSTRGFDCSGFTSYIFRKKGILLPRTAAQQARSGQKVSRSELQEGDLVFFHTTRSGISHVGMYVGNGNFIHASSRGAVRVDTLNAGYYKERYRGARRYTK